MDDVSYSLSNDAGGLFAIDGTSGVVTLAGELDYESTTSHVITVLASSMDGSTSTADFTINVLDDVSDNKVFPKADLSDGSSLVFFHAPASVGLPLGINMSFPKHLMVLEIFMHKDLIVMKMLLEVRML